MKVALSGTSSTGKTTLRGEICLRNKKFQPINIDARNLLNAYGVVNVEGMSDLVYHDFQLDYLRRKIDLDLTCQDGLYITDRSYVDVYAFWEYRCRELVSADEASFVRDLCFKWASSYDIHIFLPFGKIPFLGDGYRQISLDYHRGVSNRIQELLLLWGIKHVVCQDSDLMERVKFCEGEFLFNGVE